MPVKMIVTDLDRTLLHDDKKISDYTISVLEKCRRQGIKIVFATARPMRTVKPFEIAINPDAVIYHNGAVVRHSDGSISKTGIRTQDARKVLNELKRLFPDSKISAEISDTLFANFDVSYFWDNTSAKQTDFSDLPELSVDKIIVHVSLLREIERIAGILPDYLYVEMNENRLGLIMNRNATKLNGIKEIASRWGVPLSETAAFGDDYNDIEMLKNCGVGVAVGNALEEVKAVADALCDTNNADGVAKWLEANILPYSAMAEIDCDNQIFTSIESGVIE